MDTITLSASPRAVTGKKVKNLRREGITPIHLYGGHDPSLALQAPTQELRTAVNSAGRGQAIELHVEGGETTLTFVREIAKHPVTGELQHVDFLRVDVNTPVQATVEITLVGEPPAIRGGAGQLIRGDRSILVLALPLSVPTELQVDVSVLRRVGDNIRAGDIPLPDGVTLNSSPDAVIARIAQTRISAVGATAGGELEDEAEEERAEAEGEGGAEESESSDD